MLEYEDYLNPSYVTPKNRIEQILGACKFYLVDKYIPTLELNSLQLIVEAAILASFAQCSCSPFQDNILRFAYNDLRNERPITEDMQPYVK
jgi:hypothetical protein